MSTCFIEHPEIPQRTGKLNLVNKFDAAFFGVHYKQAHTMDPMCRIILEKSYEAIVDSGKEFNMIFFQFYSIRNEIKKKKKLKLKHRFI